MNDNLDDIIIDTEHNFMTNLLLKLNVANDNFKMMKSKNKYCSIDFLLVNEYNLQNIFIEHKQKKISGEKYNTFFIGYDKLNKIDTFYHNSNTLLVWECEDDIYFTIYNNTFLKNDTKIINGGKAYLIDKSVCGVGWNDLIDCVLHHLLM